MVSEVIQMKNYLDQIKNSDLQVLKFRSEVNTLRDTIIPIGFIYTQLPGQPDPEQIWPTFHWSDISCMYPGHFFRVLGGKSASFGTIQRDNTRELERVEWLPTCAEEVSKYNVEPNTNQAILTGNEYDTHRTRKYGLRFYNKQSEVRPINQAVRIWKRLQ